MHQNPEKGAVIPQETDQDLPMNAKGQQWPAAGLVALSAEILLKELAIIFITSTIFGLRTNNREGT